MLRFILGAFVAAFLGASMFDHVRDAAFRANLEPDGLIAVVLISVWVAALFACIACAAGAFGRKVGRMEVKPGALRSALDTWSPPLKAAPSFLDPNGPVVRQLRTLCRQDARAEIAAAEISRMLPAPGKPQDGRQPKPGLPALGSVEGRQRLQDGSVGDIQSFRVVCDQVAEAWHAEPTPGALVPAPTDARFRAAEGA